LPEIVPPEARTPISREGVMEDEFQRWTEQVTQLDLLIGSGSPEGVIEATVGREYMDDTGTAGSIKYIKRDADIAGDRTKGWILV
jgi:hypothetical protein